MTYARARLWLGISGVGTIVLLSSIALWLDWPSKWFANATELEGLAIPLLVYVLISLPFDYLGGHYLPRRYNRSATSLSAFLVAWSRGVLAQALTMALCGFGILTAARGWGTEAGVAAASILMLALLSAQGVLAKWVGGMKSTNGDLTAAIQRLESWKMDVPYMVVYSSVDDGFSGGFVGWPGRESLIIPSGWLRQLSPQVLAVQMARRLAVLATGARLRGLWLAFSWNLAGFSLAAWVSGADLASPAGLIRAALWFTIWSFAGLLLLPSFSRPAVFESDQYLRKQGIPASFIEQAMEDLDQRQDGESTRAKWVERIFHPVPSVSTRVANLQSNGTFRGAWQGARTALYLSWACFGFLSRAVHCNSGRPELWVLFPGD